MLRRVAQIAFIVASFGLGPMSASTTIAAPGYPIDHGRGARLSIELASFWGLPFPFGYAYRPPNYRCMRHVRVHTRRGWRMKRVWVCH
jgi:hypothetical protein